MSQALVVLVKASRLGVQANPDPQGREARRTPHGVEVIDATLPGKASKLQIQWDRTPNRHRWSGREYQGAVPQTDTGGQVENTKALERTRVKELGKMVP